MNNMSVLIAGTSSSYLEISKKMLKFHYTKCEVDFAYSGKECIDKVVNRNDYDLVLFDFYLGDMNGLEVINVLKGHGCKIPLIMLVDEGEDEIAMQSIERGATDYILKVRGYLTALPITVRNILERKNLLATESSIIPKIESTQVSNSTEGYFILDRRGRILSANYNMEAITSYTEDELVELNLYDLLPKGKEKSFCDWLNSINDNGNSTGSFKTEILGKTGNKIYLEIKLTAIKDENQEVVSYRGKVEHLEKKFEPALMAESKIDQLDMLNQITQTIVTSYYEPFNVLLDKFAELVCQIFRFQRATIALLDKKKKAFVKQSMIGYVSLPKSDGENMEVPQEVIERIFADRFRVKVIYYDQVHKNSASYINSRFPERRTQKRRFPTQWHKRDLILVNLMNRRADTFGYISLDCPVGDNIPTRNVFQNLELFGQLVAMAIENYYQFSAIEKRSRRLKQLLVTSNIFKLYLSLNELLKEVVWSIKFSFDYNLVALGLISKRSGNLEMRAIACDDKIKRNKLLELNLPLEPLASLLRSEYNRGKSFFVVKEENVFRPLKKIYYGKNIQNAMNGNWPIWGVLLVPIKSREGKVIGILMVDDPENNKLPTKDIIRTLEILANQVAVAIDNRILYVRAKKRIQDLASNHTSTLKESSEATIPGIKRFINRFFM
ncbi:MAG: response regulator [bacterium]